jgi:hypothetical protein
MPGMPALLQVLAMIDSDSVKPGANAGIPAEGIHLSESLQENIMGGILRLGRVTEKPQGKIVDALGMLFIDFPELSELACHPDGFRQVDSWFLRQLIYFATHLGLHH